MTQKFFTLPIGEYVLVATAGEGPFKLTFSCDVRYVITSHGKPSASKEGIRLGAGSVLVQRGVLEDGMCIYAIAEGLSAGQTGSGTMSYGLTFSLPEVTHVVPEPTGDTVTDFEAVRDFFDDAPEGAVITFPLGAEYTLWAGAYRVKPNQVVYQNNALINQADEITTTTTTALGDGTTTIGLTSTTGFLPGMYVAVRGTKSGGNIVLVWSYPRIASVDHDNNTITLSGAINSTLNITTGSYEVGANVVQAGATIMTRGPLLDAASLVNGDSCIIETVRIDGNMANNTSYNRWEYDAAIKFFSSGTLTGVQAANLCGEGIIIWGQNPKLDNINLDTLNGNGIHFNNGCYDAMVTRIKIKDANQDTTIGHSDGSIIASNGTYRTQIEGFRIYGGKRAVIGSWDSSDNAFTKISKGYAEGSWIGLNCINSAYDIEGVEITDVELVNCGPSYLGTLRSAETENKKAKRWKIQVTVREGSTTFLSGFQDSEINIKVEHADSSTITSTATAAGYANNYIGHQLGQLTGLVQFVASENTKLTAEVKDGGAPSSRAGIYCVSSAGGYNMDNTYNLNCSGNYDGIWISGNHINCTGTLKARRWAGGRTGVLIGLAVQTVNAAVPSGWDKPRNNRFVVDTYLDDSSVTSTFHVKANNAATADGWLKVSGRVHSKATSTATCYGVACQNTPKKTLLTDLEIIGPSSNFTPLFTAAAASSGDGRMNGVRCYPAPAALATNWVSEDTVSPMTLPA